MLILNPDEIQILQMALSTTIEDLEITSTDHSIPFTPEARRDMADMLRCAKSARDKISKITGKEVRMDKYEEGDEIDFLTKQS